MAEYDFDIKIAVIGSASGLRGYVQLYLFLESLSDLSIFNNLIFDKNNRSYEFRVILKQKGYYIVKISGVDSREQAEALKGVELFVKRFSLPATLDNEFYHVDLIGMKVFLGNDVFFGVVINVVNFGAGDLLEIYQNDSNDTIYHPFSQQFVLNVDVTNKRIFIKKYL